MKRSGWSLFLLLGLLWSTSCSSSIDLTDGEWIDLTHELSPQSVFWPTAEEFRLEPVYEGMTEKGYYYSAYHFSADEHGGTHIDAPVHFAKGGKTIDQIPIEELIAPAVRIDVSQKALADPEYRVAIEDFKTFEKNHGQIPKDGIVLLYTGYGRFYPDRSAYMGTDLRGEQAVAELHFPGLHAEAARWLAEEREIEAIGIDTPSIDYGQSTHFESHRILFENEILAIENVANLDRVPATGATVLALPMKIKGGSGAPIRMVAFVPYR